MKTGRGGIVQGYWSIETKPTRLRAMPFRKSPEPLSIFSEKAPAKTSRPGLNIRSTLRDRKDAAGEVLHPGNDLECAIGHRFLDDRRSLQEL